jgi:hypothetical protein
MATNQERGEVAAICKPQAAPECQMLLEAAAAASRRTEWTTAIADIALDVIVRAPLGRPPGDATNYLGGIGDVLQDKSHPINIDLSHLGVFQAVALYLDDRQIRQVTYNVERADTPSYSVRVSVLDRP